MHDPNALNIYTDGSCLPKPRRGGMGIRFVFPEYMNMEVKDFQPEGYIGATNNQMELKACSEALKIAKTLKEIKQVSRITIQTDSSYVVDNHWCARKIWPKNKWFTKNGTPVDNIAYWKELINSEKKVPKRIDYYWVKGHSKNKHNKAVDKLAKLSAKHATKKLPRLVTVRRKTTKKSVMRRSVKMQGQQILIKLITDEYLKEHKIHKYRYEVLSEESEYFGNVDFIYFGEPLRTRYKYLVRVNDDNKFPQILEVLEVV